jgi:esterase/lipase superfamily enzyme
MNDYLMSVRAVRSGQFVADVGPTKFLIVPSDQSPSPTNAISSAAWYKAVRADSVWTNSNGEARGDILFVIHGYNMSEDEVIQRHRRIRDDLIDLGFKGVVVSFDWPSDDKALAYLPDRHRAKDTAFKLVSDGISYLSGQQTPSCTINVHVFGHSTGAYVIREAFDDADDTGLPNSGWGVSQIILAAGDVSSSSMSVYNSGAESTYRHCIRLTYFSKHDEALDLSNAKRIGNAPRIGRIGLPDDAPQSAVNIDCTAYYEELTQNNTPAAETDQPHGFVGMKSHSWYFGNRMFTKDIFAVLIGTDRTVIPTRDIGADGKIVLKHV